MVKGLFPPTPRELMERGPFEPRSRPTGPKLPSPSEFLPPPPHEVLGRLVSDIPSPEGFRPPTPREVDEKMFSRVRGSDFMPPTPREITESAIGAVPTPRDIAPTPSDVFGRPEDLKKGFKDTVTSLVPKPKDIVAAGTEAAQKASTAPLSLASTIATIVTPIAIIGGALLGAAVISGKR